MIKQYEISGNELILQSVKQCRKGTHKKNGSRKYLNREEIKAIIRLFPDTFNWELARQFDVSESTIRTIKGKYDLKKSDAIMQSTRFKKGHEPINKGRRHIMKSNSGKYKKGHTPWNHKKINSIRLQYHSGKNPDEKYYMIKIAEPKTWELLHRYIWRMNYGDIPAGRVIAFKDGNTLNTNISNLLMITRKENLNRNRNRKKAADTMKKLWRAENLRASYGLQRKTKLQIK